MVRAILSASLKAGTTTAIFFPRTKLRSRPDQAARVNDKLACDAPYRVRRRPLDSGPRRPILPAVMAETKSESKAPPAKAKAPAAKAAKAATKAAADAAPPARGTCTAEKCSQPLRAKGYCRK